MKKIILLALLVTSVFASTLDIEQKIYENILESLINEKQTVNIWTDNPQKKGLFEALKNVTVVEKQKDADILVLYKTKCMPSDKIIFIGTYMLLKQCKESAVGGFYWQKGRPNLIFLRKNLQRHKIQLSQSLKEFIEDDV